MKAAVPKLALNVQELQAATGLGRRAAYQLADKLGVRVGKRLIVAVPRVEAFLAGQETPPEGSGAKSVAEVLASGDALEVVEP